MRHLLSLLATLFLAASVQAQGTTHPGAEQPGRLPFGMLGTISAATATDETIAASNFIKDLTAPPVLPVYYFSTGAIFSGSGALVTYPTSTTISDTGATFTDAVLDQSVRITSALGLGQVRKIVARTTNVLTITPAFAVTPAATDAYEVYTGELPPGAGGNPGTKERPLRTISNMATVLNYGLVDVQLDGDDWVDVANDFGGATQISFQPAVCRTNSEETCAIIRSMNPDKRATIRFTGIDIANPGFFVGNTGATKIGWWAVGNLNLIGPDTTAATEGDFFRNAAGDDGVQLLVYNVTCANVSGTATNCYSTHSPDSSAVFLNVEAYQGPASAGPMIGLVGSNFIAIGDREWRNTTVPPSGQTAVFFTAVDTSTLRMSATLIGTRIRGVTGMAGVQFGDGAGQALASVPNWDGYFIQTDLSGFTNSGVTPGACYQPTAGGTNDLVRMHFFRNTCTASSSLLSFLVNFGANPASGISMTADGSCFLTDEILDDTNVGGNQCYLLKTDTAGALESNINITNSAYNEIDVANPCAVAATASPQNTVAAVQALTTTVNTSDAAGYTAFWTNSNNFASATPNIAFGGLPTLVKCDPARTECRAPACPLRYDFSFPGSGYVPAAWMGAKIVGVSLNRSGKANMGAR